MMMMCNNDMKMAIRRGDNDDDDDDDVQVLSSHHPLLTLYVDERSRLPTVWSRLVKFFAKLGIKILVGIV